MDMMSRGVIWDADPAPAEGSEGHRMFTRGLPVYGQKLYPGTCCKSRVLSTISEH